MNDAESKTYTVWCYQDCAKCVERPCMIISFLFFEKGVNITRFFPQLNNSFDLIYNINKWKTLQILEMLSSSSLIFFSIKICWPWLLFGGGGQNTRIFNVAKTLLDPKNAICIELQSIKLPYWSFQDKKFFWEYWYKKITQLKWEYLPMEYSHLLLRLWSAPVPTFHCMVMAKDLKLLKSSFRIIGFFHHPGKS